MISWTYFKDQLINKLYVSRVKIQTWQEERGANLSL